MPEAEQVERGISGRSDFSATPSRDIRIEQIRKLQERLSFRALEARHKVALLVTAHAMNQPAQNALLKTLEEPPRDTVLILISSAPDKLLPTIRSRCAKAAFGPLGIDFIAQKVKAAAARREQPARLQLERALPVKGTLRIHLRCRRGLESFVKEEAEEKLRSHDGFRIGALRPGCVSLDAGQDFTLAALYRLRCFATLGFHLGTICDDAPHWEASLAACIASPVARELMKTATAGVPRYRLDFTERGHQRGAIRRVAERAYELAPDILNDSREAPWSIDIIPTGEGRKESPESFVELRPRLYPTPG
jgi:hypothetical protein